MANNKGKSSGDPITRWLVIGMVALVVVVGAGISIFNNTSKKTAVLPNAASVKDGYGIVFNADLTPVIDIWEDFQCPSCKVFEQTNGDAIKALIVEKKAKVVFHPLFFLGTRIGFCSKRRSLCGRPMEIPSVQLFYVRKPSD